MDAHHLLGHASPESLLNLLSSVHRKTSHQTLPAIPPSLSSLTQGDVIEIQGPSASGKTHLLYYLIVLCIMPTSYSSLPLHGWEKGAVVFDTDATFDVCRLNQILLIRLSRILSSHTQLALSDLAASCLDRLHIFRPTSSLQLATTLVHLPTYLSRNSPDTEMGLLAVDSISAFYWTDRFALEDQRHTSSNPSQPPSHPIRHIISALQSIHSSYNPMITLTNWALLPVISTPHDIHPIQLYKQHLEGFPLLSATSGNEDAPYPQGPTTLKLSHRITLGDLSNSTSHINHTRLAVMGSELQSESRSFVVLQIAGYSKATYFVLIISSSDICVQ